MTKKNKKAVGAAAVKAIAATAAVEAHATLPWRWGAQRDIGPCRHPTVTQASEASARSVATCCLPRCLLGHQVALEPEWTLRGFVGRMPTVAFLPQVLFASTMVFLSSTMLRSRAT
jgi:hypothetical protein